MDLPSSSLPAEPAPAGPDSGQSPAQDREARISRREPGFRIAILGTGYVGLVTGACLADLGNRVTCADIDAERTRRLRNGEIPFYEPGLAELVERNRAADRLRFESDPARAAADAQVVFIAVGTPPRPDGAADLSAVFAAGRLIAENTHHRYKLVVQKSTAPVGTARRLWEEIASLNGNGRYVDVAANPEFLCEGSAIANFLRPDRIVIGTATDRAERLMRKLYAPLGLQGAPLLATTLESAEMIKYASNCFLATKISYINEIAELCEAAAADVRIVAHGMGLDRRIGPQFLRAGPGFGGSCFPKDAQAMVRFAAEKGGRFRIAEATLRVNRTHRERLVRKTEHVLKDLRGLRIALLGLSFKPDTDDVRESPALDLAGRYLECGATVVAHDPEAIENARATAVGRRLIYAADPYEASRDADALVIVTEWQAYRELDLRRIAGLLRRPVVLDLRDILEPDAVVAAGLDYHCVGAPSRLGEAHRPAARAETEPAHEELSPQTQDASR